MPRCSQSAHRFYLPVISGERGNNMNQSCCVRIERANGAVTVSKSMHHADSMTFCGASVPMAVAPGTSVPSLRVELPRGTQCGLIALRLLARPDSKNKAGACAFFLEVRRHDDGGAWIESGEIATPKNDVVIDSDGHLHARSGEKIYTSSEWRAKREKGVRYVSDRNLLCSYADDEVGDVQLELAAVNLNEPTEIEKLKAEHEATLRRWGNSVDSLLGDKLKLEARVRGLETKVGIMEHTLRSIGEVAGRSILRAISVRKGRLEGIREIIRIILSA